MAPLASFHILDYPCRHKIHLAEHYLVVAGSAAKKPFPAELSVLEYACQHNEFEMICEHRRSLPVGFTWDFDCCGDMLAVGNEDWKVRVWDLRTG